MKMTLILTITLLTRTILFANEVQITPFKTPLSEASDIQSGLQKLKLDQSSEAQQLAANLLKLQKFISEQVRPWMEQVRPLLESFERYPLTPDQA